MVINKNDNNKKIQSIIINSSKIKEEFEILFNAKEKEEAKELKNQGVDEKYATLFFSFDIVNSTQYKTIALEDSLKIIKEIFYEIEKLVMENIVGIQYWRTIGDEIIFYLEIYRENEILDSVEYIFTILNRVRQKILKGEIKIDNQLSEQKGKHRYPELISLKASAWLALVGEDKDENLNIKYKTGYMTNDKRLEFQGHDIDIGFRVSEYTRNRRFALNFELAYLLSKYDECKDNLKLIGFKKMKGVWNQRKYPIVWYHNKKLKKLKGENNLMPNDFMIEGFEESFFYDEDDFCELTKEFNESNTGTLDCKNHVLKEDITILLEKICKNVNLIDRLKNMKEEIKNKKQKNRNIVSGLENEIHISVICKENKNNEIVILKRRQKNEYDFGYIKIDKIEITKLKEHIEERYLDDYGIEVKIDDKIYETYFVDKGIKRIMGLRFEGEVKKVLNENLEHRKYSSIIRVNKKNYKSYPYTEQKELLPLIEKVLKIEK